MIPIDIVITCWKREWMTKACIEAIKRNTRTPYRLIVIDSGSNGIYQPFIEKNADIYVKLDKNYGLEYAKHVAMTFVESELFVSMDNDILVYHYEDKDWLERLIELMEKYPKFMAIGCRPQILIGTGMYMFETIEELVPFHHVPGYGRIMRTDFVKKTGAWNEKRELRGHEEIWIGDKIEQEGYKMGWANFIECIHLWGKKGEDTWGYPDDVDSGHKAVWPIPTNDPQFILNKTGIII